LSFLGYATSVAPFLYRFRIFSVISATPTLRRHLSAQIKQLDQNVKDASDGVSIGGFRPKADRSAMA
jgi:hypothetical protein